MSTFDNLCDFVSETFDKKVNLDHEREHGLVVLPFDYPVPLKDDWTVKLSHASSAESEVRKVDSVNEGFLFTRISLKKAEKLSDEEWPNSNAKESLKESLKQLKSLANDDENVDAFKNLFFSTRTNKFYQIRIINEDDNRLSYDLKPRLLAQAQAIKSALECFNASGSIVFLMKFNQSTKSKVEEIKADLEQMGLSVIMTDEEAFDLSSDLCQRQSQKQLQLNITNLVVRYLIKCCVGEYFCTLDENRKIKDSYNDPTVVGPCVVDEKREKVSLADYLGSTVDREIQCPNTKLEVIPQREHLFWDISLRETKKEGVTPSENFTKLEGEITQFYEELIHPMVNKMSGRLIYSVSWEMLKPFISFPKGKRREFDWVHFSQTTMTVFEISAGNQRSYNKDGKKHIVNTFLLFCSIFQEVFVIVINNYNRSCRGTALDQSGLF